jgi:hypothetical protein
MLDRQTEHSVILSTSYCKAALFFVLLSLANDTHLVGQDSCFFLFLLRIRPGRYIKCIKGMPKSMHNAKDGCSRCQREVAAPPKQPSLLTRGDTHLVGVDGCVANFG